MSIPGKPCCIPKRETGGPTESSQVEKTAIGPGIENGLQKPGQLKRIQGAEFIMGTDSSDGFPEDGEGPGRRISVSDFFISPATVTNREFGNFVRDTQYVTEAEQFASSFVFYMQVPEAVREKIRQVPAGLPWWLSVEGACWQRPEGPGSYIYDRLDHPVVHVSWNDASAYCGWARKRLPTEAEWEFAARGGLSGKKYPWGDELEIDGRPRCNIWRGSFPNTVSKGWLPAPVPAMSYQPNGYGLYNVSGNVWEWCADWFSPDYHVETTTEDPKWDIPTGRRSMRGGSFLCHDSYCNRYRVAARGSNTPTSSSSNCGFRVAADAL